MKAHQAEHPVAMMCRLLGVSTSGYYAWLSRPPCRRLLEDRVLTGKIIEAHHRSRGTYGAPRIHRDLHDEGFRVGRKRVARLMQAARIVGVHRRKWVTTTDSDSQQRRAPDLVERDFTATGPDQLWVADITFIPTWVGFLYLAVIIDVWSRKVVGWAMRNDLSTPIVLDALDMATSQRQPDGVIHHSDQGSQYTSVAFSLRCRQAGITPSMGSVGDAYDNALCESFFATLETELIARHSFQTRSQARSAVFDFIEGFYNPTRRHSSIGHVSPNHYEQNQPTTN